MPQASYSDWGWLEILHERMPLHRKTLAEIQTAHIGVGDQRFRRARKQDLSTIDDAGAVDDFQCFAHIMVGYQYTDAPCFKVFYEIPNIRNRNRVDAGKRFVEQHD